jgi:hypothetical protein
MALPRWCKDTIIRIRPGTKTSRGSTIPDWENTDLLEIGGCSVQPASTGLSQDGRVLGISEGFTVYLPEDADVQAGDRIEFEGIVYTINGLPKKWPSATGRVSHKQLNIERWHG